jgi:hypothetical protein
MLELITWARRHAELDVTFLNNGAQDAKALSCADFVPRSVALNLKGIFLQQTMGEIEGKRK